MNSKHGPLFLLNEISLSCHQSTKPTVVTLTGLVGYRNFDRYFTFM